MSGRPAASSISSRPRECRCSSGASCWCSCRWHESCAESPAYDLLDRKDPTDFDNTSTEPYFRCPVCGKETCRWQTFFSSKHNCNMLWARCSAFDPLQEAFVCKFAAYHPRNLATIRPRAPAGLLVWALEYHTLILFFVKEPL